MNEREFFLARRETESDVFTRVLTALPKDQFDYRPHPRSQSARELVWTLTHESRACCDLVDTGSVDWRHEDPPGDVDAILADFHRSYKALSDRAKKLDDTAWQRPVKFLVGGKLMQEPPLGTFLWYLFFDAIHHRGQLSTYIRPMGGTVPSIYGPSGDSPAQ
jgi:uncharacterized damage-inducible protein DinB